MTKKGLWCLLPLCIILYACPFESTVPMAARPTEPVDTSLLGYWYGIVKDGSDFFGIEALDISKATDSSYSIVRYGKGIKGDIIMPDTGYFTGYTSYIGGQRFMNIEGSVVLVETKGRKKAPIVTTQKVFYVSAIRKDHDTLDVKTVTEAFTTRKFFSGPDDFRQLVTEMMARKNIYDEQYSMKYKRTAKPAKLF